MLKKIILWPFRTLGRIMIIMAGMMFLFIMWLCLLVFGDLLTDERENL